MLGLRRALLALFALGIIFAGLDVALVLASTHEDQKLVTAILGPVIGLSFIGTGVFAWWRRPLNRFGLLMTGVGFAWFLAGLAESNNSPVFTLGGDIGSGLSGPVPDNVFALFDEPDLADVFDYTATFIAIVIIVSTL